MGSIDTERCGIIVYNGGPGDINHEKGVRRKQTRCPTNQWISDDPDCRIQVCRQCKYYLAIGMKPKKTY